MEKKINIPENIRFCLFGDPQLTVVSLRLTQYADGNFCVLGVYPDGETERISVNIPNEAWQLEEGEFFLKNWSENEELAQKLMDSGIVRLTGGAVQTGQVRAPIAILAIE